jgi:K+-transporting ATPase ATPase C chain
MLTELKRAVLFCLASLLLVGAYHAVLWGVGRAMFPSQAEGSLLRRPDGTILGSRLIAQNFARPEYFHPRPSGVDYNAASTGGTNYGPSNPDQLAAAHKRLDVITAGDGVVAAEVPSEMITASGSGLDPDLPPAAAEIQARRVADARHVSVERVRELIRARTEGPTLGVFGRARVNVLELNLALDEVFAAAEAAR